MDPQLCNPVHVKHEVFDDEHETCVGIILKTLELESTDNWTILLDMKSKHKSYII